MLGPQWKAPVDVNFVYWCSATSTSWPILDIGLIFTPTRIQAAPVLGAEGKKNLSVIVVLVYIRITNKY
jgi:hypothetical protein